MKAVSLPQPQASLLVTRGPAPIVQHPSGFATWDPEALGPMVSRFILTDRPRPDLIGQHIAIGSTEERLDLGMYGDYSVAVARAGGYCIQHGTRCIVGQHSPLPLGHIVGSATVAACYTIKRPVASIWVQKPYIARTEYNRSDRRGPALDFWDGEEWHDISDQLPYGDWTPGRHALELVDAAPTTERCPRCWGTRLDDSSSDGVCRVCHGVGRVLDPTPAPGRSGWWEWEP